VCSATQTCGNERREGKLNCSIHGIELDEVVAEEHNSSLTGAAPYAIKGRFWRYPISNRIILDFDL